MKEQAVAIIPQEPADPIPLIPKVILIDHDVNNETDTRFRSAARLLQSLWRQDQKLSLGSYKRAQGSLHNIGSMITHPAGRAGANFLTPQIATIVRRELIYREIGACIDEDRLYRNLLSSMPLAFNLFGQLKLNLGFATKVFRLVLPSFEGEVTNILFEHSPGRGNPELTADYTAFDVLVEYTNEDQESGFIAIEQKFTETLQESLQPTRPHFDDLADKSGLFKNSKDVALRSNPCQQLWREHLLATSMLNNKCYHEGTFMVIAPRLNWQAQNGITTYKKHLVKNAQASPAFINIYLERFIEAIGTAGQPKFAMHLYQRYCDFGRIDRIIDEFLTQEQRFTLTHHGEGEPRHPSVSE